MRGVQAWEGALQALQALAQPGGGERGEAVAARAWSGAEGEGPAAGARLHGERQADRALQCARGLQRACLDAKLLQPRLL